MGGAEGLKWTNAFNFLGRYQSGVVRNHLVGDVQYTICGNKVRTTPDYSEVSSRGVKKR